MKSVFHSTEIYQWRAGKYSKRGRARVAKRSKKNRPKKANKVSAMGWKY